MRYTVAVAAAPIKYKPSTGAYTTSAVCIGNLDYVITRTIFDGSVKFSVSELNSCHLNQQHPTN